ncbi:MFS transporter [Streptomyces sp. NPDC102467]|uniref:MFS transporter n=1 Tax=Streptomyces sp. NPDC102467 TaxID=3366179 RepID=UPI0037F538A5
MTSTPRHARPPAPRHAFALLATVQLVLSTTVTTTSIAGPAIRAACGLSEGQLVTVSTAYPLAFSGLLLLGGRLSDLVGQRRCFTGGVLLYAVGCLLAVPATGFAPLVAARVVQGAGAACAAPAAMALLGSLYPDPRRRTRATAAWGPLASLGATVGVLLGGFAVAWISWRAAFAALALVGLLVAAQAGRLLPTGPPRRATRVDVPGVLLGAAGVALVGQGFGAAGGSGWSSAAALAPLGGGALLVAAFALVESRVRHPVLPPALLRSRRRAVALLTAAVGPACGAGATFVLGQYFQRARGMSAAHTALAFVPFGLVLTGIGLLAPRLSARFSARRTTVTGLLVSATGLLLLGRTGEHSPYAGELLAGLLVLPAGIGLVVSGATLVAAQQVPPELAGAFGGTLNTAMQSGPALGIALLVSLSGDGPAGCAVAFTAAGLALLAATVLVAFGLRTGRNTQLLQPEKPPTDAVLTN